VPVAALQDRAARGDGHHERLLAAVGELHPVARHGGAARHLGPQPRLPLLAPHRDRRGGTRDAHHHGVVPRGAGAVAHVVARSASSSSVAV
jgi:hypothetical protein